MNVEEVFSYMQEKNISITVDNDELVIRAPQGNIDPEIIKYLKLHKLDLLAEFKTGHHRALLSCGSSRHFIPSVKITPNLLTLVNLTQEQIDSIISDVPFGVSNIQDIYPLAPLQEGILFHYQLETQGDTYLDRLVLRFESRNLLDTFLDALQIVINRHDILRSAVFWKGLPRSVQVVLRKASLQIEELLLQSEVAAKIGSHNQTRAGAALQELLQRTDPRYVRLDLKQAPLIKATCIADQQSGQWLLALLHHHLIADHMTSQLIMSEIQMILQGKSNRLLPPLAFRNFIAQILAVSPSEHEAYFRAQLGDITEPTAPFGLMNLQGDGGHIAEATLSFSNDLAQLIRDTSQLHGVSAAVLFHVAWAQVLRQCTGQDNVVFGTVLLGRLQGSIGADRVLGMFMNTLPVRISLTGLNVSDVVRAVFQCLTDLLDHEQASLALAQRCSSVDTSIPLFTTLLDYRHSGAIGKKGIKENQNRSLDNTDATKCLWDGISEIRSDERTNYPITVIVDDFGQGFGLTAQSVHGIDPERIASYLYTAVEGLVNMLNSNPQQPICSLNILPEKERYQLLIEFNDTDAAYPNVHLIHQLFESQVRKVPHATGLIFDGQVLSYEELNTRSNQLAHYLRSKGVGPEVLVALCVKRSVEMIIGLLGILKSGGAYVPIDPDYPQERISFILEDTQAPILLTQEHLFKKLPALVTNPIYLDTDWPNIEKYGSKNPKIHGQPSNLAYVIYTSGSTGRPKGVLVSHYNVVCSTLARFSNYQDPVNAYLLLSSFAFDSSVAGIFWTLSQGGYLCLPTESNIKDPNMIGDLIFQHRISHLLALPSFYALLLRKVSPQMISLKTIIVAGESCPVELIEEHQSKLLSIDLYNEYGPTEGTVWSSVYLTNGTEINQPVSIGYPIENAKIYLLDTNYALVPIGVQGELYLGGSGLVRGYLNRPDLTAEKFIPDSFSDTGNRLYKTGDLARYRPDGNIEFLGRMDTQVKIRGYRIELGEIETQLVKCPGVREAVVLAREDSPGDKRLIAYLLGQNNAELTASGLRGQLAMVLPEYMLPSGFFFLDAFPLTPNGKLDRRALPISEIVPVITDKYGAPQGGIEIVLARLWQELLGVQQVNRNDHFFELGGHSLLVITLIEMLQQQNLTLDVMTVFAAPVLSEMALAIGDNDKQPSTDTVPPNLISTDCAEITPDMLTLVKLTQDEICNIVASVQQGVSNIQDIYPLAPLQEGMLFHYLLETQGDTYLSRSVLSFDSRARLDSFLAALQFVINRHDTLRSAIFWKGLSQPVQVVHRQVLLPIEELTLAQDTDAFSQLLTYTNPRQLRLDLQSAPLFKAYICADSLAQNGSQIHGQWLLALLNHHLVRDHLTGSFILDEVHKILQGQANILPSSLPYRNFIAQSLAVSPAEHEAYFKAQLSDITEPTAPFGLLNIQGDSGQVNEATLPLSDDLAQQIRSVARQQGVSAAVLFHVAWGQVLSQCIGRDDVVFGTVLLGRLQGSEGVGRVLGMFMNTLPVRISLSGLNVSEAVSATYRRLSELFDHEQASLALAQRCSGVDTSLPLFTTLLNYRHSPSDTTDNDLTTGSATGENNSNDPSTWDGIRMLSSEERTNYPIDISVDDLGQGFSISAQSVPAIDPERIAAYLNTAIEGLVDALAKNAQRLINTISVLPEPERHQLLVSFNGTAVDYPQDRLIHQLFEEQAAHTPAAAALTYGGQSLSYQALNTQANQLAHHLISLGVRPDDRVAICVERSLGMVIGLLGILKAGGAYVPLDPGYPKERLAYMLSDSAPVALLTQAALKGTLEGLSATVPVILLDAQGTSRAHSGTDTDASAGSAFSHCPGHNPDAQALGLQPRHLAYVIYTSGSTGQPKGVMIEHRGFCNLIRTQIRTFKITSSSHLLQFASYSFDACIWEIALSICSGACLHLTSRDTLLSGESLVALLQDRKITHAILPPSALSIIPKNVRLDFLQTLIVGGDVCLSVMAQHWAKQYHFFNAYGPTEATVCTTIYRYKSLLNNSLPIGRPIANTQIYILDAHLQPVPLGVAGEIYIGGAGVARGYLNRPGLTAERFVANPFGQTEEGTQGGAHPHANNTGPSARLYKTGDLGRWLPDGTIEFLGRNDFQVKIRGFRIELGEVESQLSKCPGVREAVVIAREDSPGDKRLVAYLLARDNAELSAADLRSQLAAVLADHQLPGAYVTLESFPLTPNGKLDRKALPAPDGASVVSRGYEAPQGPIETAIARIWQELLQLDQVGRHDHFFELGGHSLLAVQLLVRIRATFDIDISLMMLFERPTLESFSDYIVSLELNLYSENDMEDLESELDALSEEDLCNYLKEYNNE